MIEKEKVIEKREYSESVWSQRCKYKRHFRRERIYLNSGRELKEDTTEKAPCLLDEGSVLNGNDGTQLLANFSRKRYIGRILNNSRQESGELGWQEPGGRN